MLAYAFSSTLGAEVWNDKPKIAPEQVQNSWSVNVQIKNDILPNSPKISNDCGKGWLVYNFYDPQFQWRTMKIDNNTFRLLTGADRSEREGFQEREKGDERCQIRTAIKLQRALSEWPKDEQSRLPLDEDTNQALGQNKWRQKDFLQVKMFKHISMLLKDLFDTPNIL